MDRDSMLCTGRLRLSFNGLIGVALCLCSGLLSCGEIDQTTDVKRVQAPRSQLGVVAGPSASNGEYQLRRQGIVAERHDGRFGMRLSVEPQSRVSGNDEFRLEGGLIH